MRLHKFLPMIILAASCTTEPIYRDGVVSLGGRTVGSFSSSITGSFANGNQIHRGGVADKVQTLSVSDTTSACGGGMMTLRRTFTATEDVDSVRVTLEFRHAEGAEYAMIPSVCYNGNHWGRGNEPKGFSTDGVCHSYSWRRTPVPGASYSEGRRFAVALWSDMPESERAEFSVSLLPDSTASVHSLILPEEERPFVYARRDCYTDGYARRLSLRKGESVTLTAHLFVTKTIRYHGAVGKFMDKVWECLDKSEIGTAPCDTAVWNRGINYAKNSLWAEEEGYKGLSIGLLPNKDGGWKQRGGGKYEIGWCGQNASFANSLLTDYLRKGDEESLQKGLATLKTWTSPGTVLPSGLYVANYDNILLKKENFVSDACNLGTAARNFFEGAELLRKCAAKHGSTSEEWPKAERLEEAAYGILDFVMADQQDNGCYGKGWDTAGKCVAREGTVGAFLISPMITAYRTSGDPRYLSSALEAYDYYMGGLRHDGFTTAGALDTWCIDKESSVSVLRGAIELYELKGRKSYLRDAEMAAQYLSTWLWHYNAWFPGGDIVEAGYNTLGATAVSVQHHHLDPYALLYIPELRKLADYTGNNIWNEKADAIWNNGCQLVSDGSLVIHGRIRPEGSQNEAFLHCNWGQGGPDGERLNDWLVAWPGAFRLEVLRKYGRPL